MSYHRARFILFIGFIYDVLIWRICDVCMHFNNTLLMQRSARRYMHFERATSTTPKITYTSRQHHRRHMDTQNCRIFRDRQKTKQDFLQLPHEPNARTRQRVSPREREPHCWHGITFARRLSNHSRFSSIDLTIPSYIFSLLPAARAKLTNL